MAPVALQFKLTDPPEQNVVLPAADTVTAVGAEITDTTKLLDDSVLPQVLMASQVYVPAVLALKVEEVARLILFPFLFH